MKKFAPAMFQYWYFKQDNYDKILCFKIGKFYELFFEDAMICHKLLDLKWMSNSFKLHVGFPEKSLHKYCLTLVNHGFKVAVVE
jgi:DNA mismatch repair protein MSH6